MATTTADEFMDATLDVWELAPESATRVGHPAPFPVELPQRLIDLYTYEGDVVLDPFMGSGTTAVAAVRAGRHYLGYDTDEAYVKAARERAAAEVAGCRPTPARRGPTRRSRRRRDAARGGRVHARRRQGHQASPLRRRGRRRLGRHRRGGRRVAGARGRGQHGRCAAGLRRSDVLFRTLGEAAVLTTAGHRVLVLTTDLPPAASAPLAAVRAARGVTLVDALELGAAGVARAPGGLRRRRRSTTRSASSSPAC